MSRMGYRARVDDNQKEVVDELRSRGISVALGHDDFLLGYMGKTYWIEWKDKSKCFLKDGITFRKGAIKPSQSKLRSTWRGQYAICWEIEQIMRIIGYEQ